MRDYSTGHIGSEEARQLITALNERLRSDEVCFYPGVSYRHICKIKGHEETLGAVCTPPHDIPEKPVADYLPRGEGSAFLRELMERSRGVLEGHPVNVARERRGEVPATQIWLFWGAGRLEDMPAFRNLHGLHASMTSGVDLLDGLALMADMDVLAIPGVTDHSDNDYAAQAKGAMEALGRYDLVVVHVEAPDEAAHAGDIAEKVETIECIDEEVVGRIRSWRGDALRVLVMPDHPTPIEMRTHSPGPVPFLLWGHGFQANGAERFTEAEAAKAGLYLEEGYRLMDMLIGGGEG
jgi:2,3-bisphosphoglycerate-independent phosphoglycerate mutase